MLTNNCFVLNVFVTISEEKILATLSANDFNAYLHILFLKVVVSS